MVANKFLLLADVTRIGERFDDVQEELEEAYSSVHEIKSVFLMQFEQHPETEKGGKLELYRHIAKIAADLEETLEHLNETIDALCDLDDTLTDIDEDVLEDMFV